MQLLLPEQRITLQIFNFLDVKVHNLNYFTLFFLNLLIFNTNVFTYMIDLLTNYRIMATNDKYLLKKWLT